MSTFLAKIIADFETQLATKLSAGASSCDLQSITDDDGVSLPNGTYFFTIDGDNSQKEHIVATLTGTALTAIKSISRQGVQTSNAVREHRVGASVKITDFAHIKYMNDLLDGTTGFNSAVKLGYNADPSINSSDLNKFATVSYVNGVAVAGAPNASTTVKGIAEEATTSEINAFTQLGTTGAELFVNPFYLSSSIYFTQLPSSSQKSALVGSSGAVGTLNKYLTEDDATVYGGGLTQQSQNATQAVGEVDATTKANKICQTFILTLSSQIAIYLNKQANTGTNAGDVIIEFFAVDGSNNPTGAALATTTITAATWNAYPTGNNYITIAYTFTIGTTYAMVVRQSTADNSNHINLGYQNTDVYASGTLKRYNVTDGWVAVNGDLTFSLFGTVNNKVIRRTGTGTAYMAAAPVAGTDLTNKTYVDAQVAAIPISQQIIGADTVITTASTGTKCATDSSGTIMVLIQRISGTWYVTRYTTDNGIWYRTHSVTLSWGGSIYNSVTILGSYVYVYGLDTSGPTVKVARFNLADLTSETNMTISGGSIPTADSSRGIVNDGTAFYISAESGGNGRIKKYTLSGTTLTYVSDIDYTSIDYNGGLYSDGTYLYNVAISGGTNVRILKYTLATGGAALSTTDRNFNGVFTGGIPIGFIPFSTTKFWVVMHGTIDVVKTMETKLITKP
ncbi:MAG: hypothetical protein JSS91_00780 [Bacteroidetes bacterium]|nr:hypothetical protein [Bacteroidota bacterium]